MAIRRPRWQAQTTTGKPMQVPALARNRWGCRWVTTNRWSRRTAQRPWWAPWRLPPERHRRKTQMALPRCMRCHRRSSSVPALHRVLGWARVLVWVPVPMPGWAQAWVQVLGSVRARALALGLVPALALALALAPVLPLAPAPARALVLVPVTAWGRGAAVLHCPHPQYRYRHRRRHSPPNPSTARTRLPNVSPTSTCARAQAAARRFSTPLPSCLILENLATCLASGGHSGFGCGDHHAAHDVVNVSP